MEATERPRLLLIPYIYKQDRHKEKNCKGNPDTRTERGREGGEGWGSERDKTREGAERKKTPQRMPIAT